MLITLHYVPERRDKTYQDTYYWFLGSMMFDTTLRLLKETYIKRNYSRLYNISVITPNLVTVKMFIFHRILPIIREHMQLVLGSLNIYACRMGIPVHGFNRLACNYRSGVVSHFYISVTYVVNYYVCNSVGKNDMKMIYFVNRLSIDE